MNDGFFTKMLLVAFVLFHLVGYAEAQEVDGIRNDDIDLGLVHSNKNKMADVYIDIDYSLIDNANRKVLDLVFGKGATKL